MVSFLPPPHPSPGERHSQHIMSAAEMKKSGGKAGKRARDDEAYRNDTDQKKKRKTHRNQTVHKTWKEFLQEDLCPSLELLVARKLRPFFKFSGRGEKWLIPVTITMPDGREKVAYINPFIASTRLKGQWPSTLEKCHNARCLPEITMVLDEIVAPFVPSVALMWGYANGAVDFDILSNGGRFWEEWLSDINLDVVTGMFRAAHWLAVELTTQQIESLVGLFDSVIIWFARENTLCDSDKKERAQALLDLAEEWTPWVNCCTEFNLKEGKRDLKKILG